ncbi:uncharacterized protein LOC134314928 isoform X1 [Trichomycterus rosablanca]|uniref:uncharacterized protein LOC134314928 isoform X1 n=1 Tax=Trichomycterus rosablanca TaxID=2290929 RepID=UPI002F35C9FA
MNITSTRHQESGSLPSSYSAQAAELVALTEACKFAAGHTVTIYTDSRYSFGVVHSFGTLWKQRNFLTSSGKAIAHHTLVSALLDAVLLPKQVAVVHVRAHTNGSSPEAQGNARADAAAKKAARDPTYFSIQATVIEPQDVTVDEIQQARTAKDVKAWRSSGCTLQRVSSRTKLSPFEIMFGRPPNTGCAPKRDTLALEDDHMQRYCATLCSVLSDVHRRVKESLPSPAVTGHTVQPGDWILTKVYKRANWKAHRWQGPFQVLLVTHTAVKIAERDTWIHISHCKKAPTPE